MSTSKDTVTFILEKLGHTPRFASRPMFGEYALYADGKVVALVCDDTLYIKIHPATAPLDAVCEQDAPYPGAKPYYVISEDQLAKLDILPSLLFSLAAAIPAVKKKKRISD